MLLRSVFVSTLAASALADVTSYPRSSLYNASAVYDLSVGGVAIDTVGFYGYDYAYLAMDEGDSTEYVISLLDGSDVSSYTITPRSLAISATTQGSSLKFSVSEAYYLIIKINDNDEFVILADPPETNEPPSKGPNIFNVNDYGASGSGSAITTGVQDALDAAGNETGSTVYVPEGIYTVGNLIIPSDTSLYLAPGSILRFTGNPADYTQLYNKPGLGPGTWWIQTAVGTKNIKIYGRGTIDANGYGYQKGKHVAQVIVPVGTTNFQYDGPLIRESSFWTVVPTQSSGVRINNLKVMNRIDMVQNDGIDVVECTDVFTDRAIAIANDDSFSTKTWPYDADDIFSAYPYSPMPLADVGFNDCISWTHCYGFKIGQGVYQYQKDITFQSGTVYTAAVGIGVDHKYGTGYAQNVTWKDIVIENLSGENLPGIGAWMAIFVELDGRGVGPLYDMFVDNIRVYDLGVTDAWLKGYNSSVLLERASLNNIYLNDSTTPTTSWTDLRIVHMHTLNVTLTAD